MTQLEIKPAPEELEILPEYYTKAEVTTMLKIRSEATFHRMLKNGRLPPPMKLTKQHWVWPKTEFEPYLRSLPEP